MSTEYFIELSKLSPIEYDAQRQSVAKDMGIRVSTLDAEVEKLRKGIPNDDEQDELVIGVEPWHEAVDGDTLAKEIAANISRYCVLPSSAIDAATLWLLSAYSINIFRIFPKLGVTSPQKRCGKTTALEVFGAIAPRALPCSNLSASVLFRAIEKWQPTLSIDEMDTYLDNNKEMCGVINSGHTKKMAFVLRNVGDSSNFEPKKFSTWSPMILARIGEFSDTIKDRSIPINCQRMLAEEKGKITRLPVNLDEKLYNTRRRCQRFADDNGARLSDAKPDIPSVNNDRAEDNWWPLLAVADLIGGGWPERARQAMKDIEASKLNTDADGDLSIALLLDIRSLIKEKGLIHSIPSSRLVEYLNVMDERPWPTMRSDRGLSAHVLAKMLKPFGIKTGPHRAPGSGPVNRGYSIEQLDKVFSRYLPEKALQPLQVLQPATNLGTCNTVTLLSDGAEGKESITTEAICDGQTRNADGNIYAKNFAKSREVAQ